MTQNERLPTMDEQFGYILPEMKAAKTKADAFEAIEPLVGLAVLLDRCAKSKDLPPGGPMPEQVARVTPLSAREVRREIERKTWEFVELAGK